MLSCRQCISDYSKSLLFSHRENRFAWSIFKCFECFQPSRTLRSSGKGLLTVYRPKTKHGKASFKYFASYSWNKLPETLRCAPNVATFKSRLKTFLFCRAYEHWFASLICLLQEYLSKLWVVAPIFHMIMLFQYTYFLIFYFYVYHLLFTCFTLLLCFILLFNLFKFFIVCSVIVYVKHIELHMWMKCAI